MSYPIQGSHEILLFLFRTCTCACRGETFSNALVTLTRAFAPQGGSGSGLVGHAGGSVGTVQVGPAPEVRVISFVSARAVKRRYHHPFRRGGVEPLNSAQCR